MAGKFAQDFFISYCHRDRLHVEEKLVVPLKEKGVEVAWDRDRAGKIAPNLLARLTEWVNTSQITIVVLSKRYAEAYTKKSTGYLRYEFDTAEQLQVESGQTRVVVLHLDDCRVPDPRMSKYLRGTCVDDELLEDVGAACNHEARGVKKRHQNMASPGAIRALIQPEIELTPFVDQRCYSAKSSSRVRCVVQDAV